LGFETVVVLVCFDGSLVFVVLLVCPSGFAVVVVLELLWANAALPTARLSPTATAANFDVGLMVFLLCCRSTRDHHFSLLAFAKI